jgi:uncharacterized protein (TIGR02147 family)
LQLKRSLFDYQNDYRLFLKEELERRAQGKRGEGNRLAIHLKCQPAFVSQVLHEKAHFNLEHGARINGYFGHTPSEGHYFLLLLQKTRAGTQELRDYFQEQISEIQNKRTILKERFKVEDTLSKEDKSIYYSSWIYGAIRLLITIPEFSSREKIANRLRLPEAKVNAALEFLLSRKLVAEAKGALKTTKKVMHLGNDSSMITKHHNNWRNKAISSLDFEGPLDLHYSLAITISREDALRIKKMLIDEIESVRKVIKESPEEDLFAIGLDFFQV